MRRETAPYSGTGRGVEEEQNGNHTLQIGDATEVLNSDRRRRAVEFMDANPGATFREIAEGVAETEFGAGYSGKERKRVYVALYQSHFPKLDEFGVVAFDVQETTVHRGPAFEEAVRYLRGLQRVEDERDEGDTRRTSRFQTFRDLL